MYCHYLEVCFIALIIDVACYAMQLLSHVTAIMKNSSQLNALDTSSPASNLLLIISDGRGLYLEGGDAVKSAIRQATACGIFVVFVIIDNPFNKVRQ